MKPKPVYEFESIIMRKKYEIHSAEQQRDRMVETSRVRGQSFRYPFTSKDYDDACHLVNTLKSDEFTQKWIFELDMNRGQVPKCFWKHKDIYDYLGIIPFTPSVMINISPDWKSARDKMTNTTKCKRLTSIIEAYMLEGQRYDYYSFVIENGADGDHVHAHIVAHINPKLEKSVNTHLAKGNHTQQLVKCAKKVKGMEGTIKGVSVQKIFLRTEEMVSDKLDYLVEERKPDGHKNKSVLSGKIDKVLFTAK